MRNLKMRDKNKSIQVYALVPAFFGLSGDAVNERQFILTFAKISNIKVTVITFISVLDIILPTRAKFIRKEISRAKERNITVIPLPSLSFVILSVFYYPFVSLILSFYLLLKIKIMKIRPIIYARNSRLGLGLVEFPEVAQRCIIKIPEIFEDEVHTSLIIKKLIAIYDRRVVSRAWIVAFPSPLLYVSFIKKRYLKLPRKVIFMSAGVDYEQITRIEKNAKPSEEELKICFLGSLAWWQGVDILVRAVAILKNKFPELRNRIKLEIIGDGPQRALIERLCEVLGVNCELTGYLPHEDALKRLSCCGVLVLPRRRSSTTEAVIPLKVIEAWALGVPVVATRHEVFEFYGLKDMEDLMYCEPTPESVATALAKVMVSRDLHKKLSERGPQIAKLFDYQFISKNLTKIFT
jgi:glycosyltransferase involved in cell wall biosynthesis